jgi:tetratricopeptide (TPR) repeat protein
LTQAYKTKAGKPSGTDTHAYHLGVAEAGKCCALKGDHAEALRHYREAIKLAVSARAPEVFFRHYSQCVLESLELTGSYQEVLAYCEKADQYYQTLEQDSGTQRQIHARDHGSILERQGLIHAKLGDREAAFASLKNARHIAGEKTLALTEQVIGWLQRGLHPDPARLTDAQRKHHYYSVRADQVDARRAQPLPPVAGTGRDPLRSRRSLL